MKYNNAVIHRSVWHRRFRSLFRALLGFYFFELRSDIYFLSINLYIIYAVSKFAYLSTKLILRVS